MERAQALTRASGDDVAVATSEVAAAASAGVAVSSGAVVGAGCGATVGAGRGESPAQAITAAVSAAPANKKNDRRKIKVAFV